MGISQNQIYLDYNATAPLRPEAAEAISSMFEMPSNPSSVHLHGRDARARLEIARTQVALLAGARPQDVIFTSGGTESNNMVLAGYQHIITSAVEHDAVLAACPDAYHLAVDRNGVVKLDQIEAVLASLDQTERSRTLVSVMAANNETGVIQPIAEIARLCASHDVHIHSDMVQMAGKIPINLMETGLDYITLSA
ncbi:MAG: aminotransferase class V-fold PLP-dependent enzyme, partial [Pseudomonadota bacterium]|nr:aminotransferase class V-fold PLP-dependent enzyme [Pseudomonadota bacterium]